MLDVGTLSVGNTFVHHNSVGGWWWQIKTELHLVKS